MERQPNISNDQWAKILSSGAFLCWRGNWWFFELKAATKTLEQNLNKIFKNQIVRFDFFDISKPQSFEYQSYGPYQASQVKSSLQEFLTSLKAEIASFSWFEHKDDNFSSCFNEIENKIKNGGLKKAVPVSFLCGRGQISPRQLAQLIVRLCDAPEVLIPYGLWSGHEGFIGATPEILFYRKDNEIETMALAGTAVQDFSKSLDLLNDPKELEEHQFVIRDIKEKLATLVDLNIEPTKILELPHLRHLLTVIRGKIKEKKEDLDLIRCLHPTSALGVYPREYGLQWLKELPGQSQRKSFGAPIYFYLPNDEVVTLVGLRRLEWQESDVRIGAGCGLVRGSIFAREWSEVNRKIESVRKLLGI